MSNVIMTRPGGGGFLEVQNVSESTTIEEVFRLRHADEDPDDFLVRVNRRRAPREYVVQEGDRVSFIRLREEVSRPTG